MVLSTITEATAEATAVPVTTAKFLPLVLRAVDYLTSSFHSSSIDFPDGPVAALSAISFSFS